MGSKKSMTAAELSISAQFNAKYFFYYLAPAALISHGCYSTYGRLTEPRRMIQSSATFP